MAITSVIEQWKDRAADGDFERLGMIRSFEVIVDSASDNEDTVSTAVDPSSGLTIPNKGDAHDVYSYATVQNVQIERDSLYRWFVTCIYGGGAASYEQQKYVADVEWDAVESQEDIDCDISGQPITNAALERFEGVKATFFDPVLRVTRSEATFNFAVAAAYMRTLNAAYFLGAAPGEAFMGPIRARRIWENGTYFWRVSYNIFFRPSNPILGGVSPWQIRLLNEGYRINKGQNTDGSPKWEELTDSEGEKISKPVLLNANGSAPLAAGTVANWKYYARYPLANWGPLGLEYS